jgi:hypothetical protein
VLFDHAAKRRVLVVYDFFWFFLNRNLVCACRVADNVNRKSIRQDGMMPDFNPNHKAVLDDLLLSHPLIRPGKMFGYPAYYVGKKLCICLYEQGVGVKLPEKTASRLLETGQSVVPFQPLGRPKMREWIQINLGHSEDYRQYLSLFEASIQHVQAQGEKQERERKS